jgi:hypothetical protein
MTRRASVAGAIAMIHSQPINTIRPANEYPGHAQAARVPAMAMPRRVSSRYG